MANMLSQVQVDTGTKIKIGVVLPLTGTLALTGQKVLQGIQLAVNQLPFQNREKSRNHDTSSQGVHHSTGQCLAAPS